jgi:non-lysosomal glucosylceramidase
MPTWRALCVLFMLCVTIYAAVPETFVLQQGRRYSGSGLQEIAFPLGGLGTGSVSLGGRGDLRDWEIFNRPDKGGELDFTFFAIWAKPEGGEPVARILERKIMPPFGGGHGVSQRQLSGIPRLDEAEFRGEYPVAQINFKDGKLPVQASLQAWSPFIPLNEDDSSLPVAFFTWHITNPGAKSVHVALAATLLNPIGDKFTDVSGKRPGLGKNLNQFIESADFRGLYLTSLKLDKSEPNYGSISLTTSWQNLNAQTRWYRGGWWDSCHRFWDDFSDDGRIQDVRDAQASGNNQSDVGCLVLQAEIPPQGSVDLPLILTWHFPNRENYWNDEKQVRGKIMKNFVAAKFQDAWQVAGYAHQQKLRLQNETRLFHDALFSSTMPDYVLDAMSSQMSTLKTNVCLRLDDGSFFGFEGNSDHDGCCPMNCTHVWNYENTLAFLFPALERSMRETDFLHNTLPNGYMTFRTLLPLGDYWWNFKACADGQMGSIIRVYREWRLSGDNQWLRKLWPKIQAALEFAWNGCGNPPSAGLEWTKERVAMPWDMNKDGVMEAEQHNTYDIEFYGPNTMMGSLYLGALKAGSEMALAMGEKNKSKEYQKLYESGRKWYDQNLWNGKYYFQDMYVLKGLKVPEHLVSPENQNCGPTCACKQMPDGKKAALQKDETVPKYQYGQGCLSDQLLGQYVAHVAGLGYVLDPEHVKIAMKSIFDNNFKSPMNEFANVQRVYALNDEAGLLLCTWPNGGRPALPFVYSDEVWTGIEYQVAATLIYNGWIREGLQIVQAVRNRYNGGNRNPWDEIECGHHYARAMASWALLPALSGYQYDGIKATMGFAPRLNPESYAGFWSCGSGWGVFSQTIKSGKFSGKLELKYGTLQLNEFTLAYAEKPAKETTVLVNGKQEPCRVIKQGDVVTLQFARTVRLEKDQTLEISL